jgi:hypothetical protein
MFPKPIDYNYIVFQTLHAKPNKNFVVLTLPDDYKVGVGLGEELQIKDKSVKANHGSICYDTELDEVVLRDNISKSGTYVLI